MRVRRGEQQVVDRAVQLLRDGLRRLATDGLVHVGAVDAHQCGAREARVEHDGANEKLLVRVLARQWNRWRGEVGDFDARGAGSKLSSAQCCGAR
jgi:hypothetical protein